MTHLPGIAKFNDEVDAKCDLHYAFCGEKVRHETQIWSVVVAFQDEIAEVTETL